VPWQAWQSFELGTWFGGFPVAKPPLWQVAQGLVTPEWSKRAGVHQFVTWQSPHWSLLGRCWSDFPSACRGPPRVWHCPHWIGVPENTPPR
jgi:hypothetical protein